MYTIDPSFSVYHLIERIEQQSILLNHRRTMSLISYEIENATLLDNAKTRVFAGFQYLSKFTPQIKRYQKLAASAESVYIFGVPDVQTPAIPNLNVIPLSVDDKLSREWFVIAHGVLYSSALATEEISRITDADDQRQFKGIWTFDIGVVSILHDWLASLVDARPLPDAESQHNFVQQRQIIGQSFDRLNVRVKKLLPTTQTEIKTAIRESKP